MDSFVEWNLRLLQAFFSPASQGDEVWLAIDPDELDAIGPDLGGDLGFLEAVLRGPPWPTLRGGQGPFIRAGHAADFTGRALGLVSQRCAPTMRPPGYVDPGGLGEDYRGHDAPTYLPFLAALIRCSAAQDENGYYASLRESLHLPQAWSSPEMERLEDLWLDLATWSAARGAPFGRFRFRQLGGFRFVGVPRSQSIISRHDATALTRVFAQAGVRPGQAVTDQLLEDIRSDAADADFLSAPFREALANNAFAVPVRERLRALLDDWDGVVVNASRGGTVVRHRGAQEFLEDHVEVALSLGTGNSMPWQVRWRVPAIRDAGLVSIATEGTCWTASLAGTEPVTAGGDSPGSSVEQVPVRVLARSEYEDVGFEASLQEDESAPTLPVGRLVLRRAILRSFVAEREGAYGPPQVVLHERPLPANGGAYFLAAQSNVHRLQDFLRRNGVEHEECPSEGLPDGWSLVYLPECAQLGDDVRDELPDGEAVRSRPRIVRLVGGRPIQRAGLRQYLAYDLPSVELDAPPGVQLRAAGLGLDERSAVGTTGDERRGDGPVGMLSGLRRFDILVPGGTARSFLIEAVRGGQVIGTARLRLAPGSGLQAQVGQGFSLDRQGNPRGDNAGLLGAQLCSTDALVTDVEGTIVAHLGPQIDEGDIPWITQHPAARFLDSLAQSHSGSMPYGTARDQLRRLAQVGHPGVGDDALVILTELRSRGFLEIESDSKGHWVRIHAVPAALFTLPVTTPAGSHVLAIAGTLRQQHWEELCGVACHGGSVHLGGQGGSSLLPTVHISVPSLDVLHGTASATGFVLVHAPAFSVARWAARLEDVRAGLEGDGVESLGSGAAVERYVPATGQFTPSRQGTGLDLEPRRQLLRLQDAETGRHQIYTLGFHDANGRPRYSFVRDSRWGVWLALDAFAQYVRDCHGVTDASPWPFQYCRREHTLWLPARINLPAVLERALVLCSGDRPVRVQVYGQPHSGAIYLESKDGGRPIGSVSSVYDGFAPRYPRWATWLGYRWVPEELAGLVAEKLGGCLHYVAR